MKRLLVASALFFPLTAAAPVMAADLSAAPAYKAPPLAPAYNWTGFYAGVNLGGGWDHRSINTFNTVTGAQTGTASTGGSGVVGGGQIGYNYMLAPNWLIGLEADISGADVKGSGQIATPAVTIQGANKIDVFGTVRGRLGYAWNNWLFYGTGGFAWANENETRTQVAGVIGNATPGTAESASTTATGWTAGGGIEWGFSRNWTARVEYLHLGLGTNSFVFPVAQRRTDASVNADLVRAGVNFRF